MKLRKKSNILLLVLSLILSTISLTGVLSHLPSEGIKTVLVVNDYSENTRFSIQYLNANKEPSNSFSKYSQLSVTSLQNVYNLKEIVAIKTYSDKTVWLRVKQLHKKLCSIFIHKTLYNNIA